MPTTVLESDREDVTPKEAARTAALLQTSWQFLNDVVATAPAVLRKGPRGGGRDRDAIAAHVAEAERMFGAKVGLTLPAVVPGDMAAAAVGRDLLLQWCRTGKSLPASRPGWPPRYAARRLIWHVLDHLWEIEDRSH